MDRNLLLHEINERNDHSNEMHAKPDTESFSFDDYIAETISLSNDIDYKEGICGAILVNVARDMTFGNFEKGYEALLKVENDYNIDQMPLKIRMRYYSPLVVYYDYFKGERETAIRYAKIELNIAEALGEIQEIMRCKMNIGSLNIALENYETSIEFLNEVTSYYESTHNNILLCYCYFNLGEAYFESKNHKRAKELFYQALIISEKENEIIIVYHAMLGLASMEKLSENYEEALNLLNKALKNIKLTENIQDEFKVVVEMVSVYKLMNQYKEALTIITRVEKHIEKIENKKVVMDFYKDKADVCHELDLLNLAYESLTKYLELYETEESKESCYSMNQLIQEEYNKNLERLNTIAMVGRELTMLSDIDQVLMNVKSELSKVLDLEVIGIGEIKDNTLHYNHYFIDGEKTANNSIPLDGKSNFATWCTQHRKPVIINNLEEEYSQYVDELKTVRKEINKKDSQIHSLMYAPLILNDEILGVFTIQSSRRDAYSSVEISVFQIIVDYVAIAVKNVSQKKSLEQLSIRDNLTQMYNRRGLMDFFENRVLENEDDVTEAAKIMLDLDHFKIINDTYGHLVGDLVLREVAKSIMALEDIDIRSGRLGGEEFGVIVVNKERTHVTEIAEKIRRDIEALEIVVNEEKIKVTTSVGVSCLTCTEPPTYHQLYFEADHALYSAKEQGRNRVQLYSL